MPISSNSPNSISLNIGASVSGAVEVTSSAANPVYVTGTITSVTAASGTFYVTEGSVGEVGQPVPLSATLIGAHDEAGNLAHLHVDGDGNLYVSVSGGITVVPSTASQIVTSSQAFPVWITGTTAGANTAGNNLLNIAPSSSGIGQATTFLYGWNSTQWERINSDGNSSDDSPQDSGGGVNVNAYVRLFNGSSFDRLQGIGGAALTIISGTELVSGSQPVYVTGTVAVSQTNLPDVVTVTSSQLLPIWVTSTDTNAGLKQAADLAQYVTSSEALPVWVTSTDTNAGLKQAADLSQYVTSSQLLPVWVTSTDTNAGLKQAADLSQYVTSSEALPVWVTGILTTTGSTTVASITSPVVVTSSITSPVYVSSTLANPVVSIGLHGVTGTVSITSGTITTVGIITNNVHTDGLHGVTGTVAISSGVITAHIDGLVGVSGAVAISSGTITTITNNVHIDGLVGVSGAVTISSGTVTAHTDGLIGVTGTVSITSGTITSITNPVTITSSFTNPVYITSTLASPINTVGLVGVSGAVAITSGVITAHSDGLMGVTGTIAISSGTVIAHSDGLVGVTGAVAITSGVITSITNAVVVTSTLANPSYVTSTINNPVNVTASSANPVTIAVTGTMPITGTVTLGLTSSIVTVGLHGVTGTVTVVNTSGVFNVAQTGTWYVTGSTTIGTTGTLTVSQSNPVLTASVTQTGSWRVTGTITTNIVTASIGPLAIGAAGNTVIMSVGSSAGIAVTITGTWNGTLGFYASFDGGTNWWAVEAYGPPTLNELVSSTTTVNGVFVPYDIAGATHICVSATLWSSGQAGISINGNNHQTIGQISMRENGSATPSYGVQIAGDDAGTLRFIKVDQSGALFVSSSNDRPVWITGVITSVQSASGTFIAIEDSVGGDGQIAPVSATLVGGHNTGTLQSINVDVLGNVVVTGTVTAYQSAAFMMTSTIANPVWITGAIATTVGTQLVSSTIANPVWITGTSTVTGTVNIFQTGTLVVSQSNIPDVIVVTATQGSPVWTTSTAPNSDLKLAIDGAQFVTSSESFPIWMTSSIAHPIIVSASQANPVTIAITGVLPITGTVTLGLTSSLATTTTGLVGVTGTVSITSGTITSITNAVVVTATVASPAYVTSTAANPINSIGLHGVTGTIAISSGVLTSVTTITNNVHTDGLHGVSGTVAITSGTITTVTNPVIVTSTFTSPVYVTSTSGNPVNVTASSANPVSVTIIGAIAANNAAAIATGTLNPVTGTLALAMNGGTTIALSATAQGWLAVSQTNPSAATGGGGGIPTATLNPASGNLMLGMNNTGTVGLAATPGGILKVMMGEPGTQESFGSLVTSIRVPQVETQFFATAPTAQLFVSSANGATSSGPTNGLAVFNTTTAANTRITGTTPGSVLYTAQYEVFGAWTWQFTTPTNANSYQRIGLYNDTDGFFVGWDAQQFGLTYRYSTSDTFVTQSAWNVDTLTGQASSRFTSGSIPVSLNPATLNLYRVRLGWLGAAPISYEVMSPDGEWVVFHIVHFPNSLNARASITNPNLPIKFDISKTPGGSDNLFGYAGCFVAGIASYPGASTIDYNNTTRVALGANSSFTGTATSIAAYSQIKVSVYSDQTSSFVGKNSGLRLQFSQDGIQWGDQESFWYAPSNVADGGETYIVNSKQDYVRVIYQNGTAIQGVFALETMLCSTPTNGDLACIDDGPAINQHGLLTVSTMWGPTGTISGSNGFAPASISVLGGLYVTSTVSSPVVITGILEARQTGSFIVGGTVTSSQTGSWQVAGTVTAHTDGLHGVTGTVSITSGTLTGITNTVIVTSTITSPLWITSSVGTIVVTSQSNLPAGTQYVTSAFGSPVYVSSTITSPINVTGILEARQTGAFVIDNPGLGLTVDGAVLVTGASTPSDTFANPTTALLAFVLGAQWDGTQWVRTRGGVSGTLVQTKPAATTNVAQVNVTGTTNHGLLAANINRLGACIQNVGSSTFAVHIKLGAAAALNSYTVRVAQNGYYEVPANYNGAITACTSGSQAVMVHVTEITQ